MAYIAGKHFMGPQFTPQIVPRLISCLPQNVELLKRRPAIIDSIINSIIEPAIASGSSVEITVKIASTIQDRMDMFSRFANKEDLALHTKLAGEVYHQLPTASRKRRERDSDNLPLNNLRSDLGRTFSTYGEPATDTFTVQGVDGRTYHTTRSSIQAGKSMESLPEMARQVAGAGMGLAAIGAVLSNAPLTAKLIMTPIFAAAAAGLLGGSGSTIETSEGREVSSRTLFHVKNASTTKLAFDTRLIAPAFGAALPSALALDYVINSKIRPRFDPYYQGRRSIIGRGLDAAGKVVAENPITAITSGTIAGSAAKHMVPLLFKKRPIA